MRSSRGVGEPLTGGRGADDGAQSLELRQCLEGGLAHGCIRLDEAGEELRLQARGAEQPLHPGRKRKGLRVQEHQLLLHP